MTNELLITGIPRSGTSYLCSILNQVRDTVVINEPEEVLRLLANSSGIPLSDYYRFIRQRIIEGKPVTNKIVDGRFIEDTNDIDIRTPYVPCVDTPDFLLGTKNTLVYLNTLERILEHMPEAILVACVRHPHDTIASWQRVTFPHIRHAAPAFLLNHVDGERRRKLERILATAELAQRHAMLWHYLAGLVNRHSGRLIVVRYEDMVADPTGTLERIYATASIPLTLQQPLEPSTPRRHEDAFDAGTLAAIAEHCADSARLLGYDL